MTLSSAEVGALALKAGRGAGLPVGLAEDFARAAVALVTSQKEACHELSAALAPPLSQPSVEEDDTTLSIRKARCVFAAPITIDALKSGTVRVVLFDIDSPGLLRAAFRVAELDSGHDFSVNTFGPSTVVTLKERRTDTRPKPGPVSLSKVVHERLSALAALTFVPDTAASRANGAGGAGD